MTDHPILYRKRLIPDECILLKDDRILFCDSHVILTSWDAIHPKKNLHHGYSCYFLDEGIKVSKFYTEDNTFLYWYCDIVDYEVNETLDTVTSIDLCLDVVIFPDGSVRVMDMDELSLMKREGKLTEDMLHHALLNANKLLEKIYHGEFDEYTKFFEHCQ